MCSSILCVLWLQPSTCHQASIQTANAHLHINTDVLQQLNYNFLWAVSCLFCPLEEQEMRLCRWQSNDLWLFAWIWWSSGSCPRWAHMESRSLKALRDIHGFFLHLGCQNVLTEYLASHLIPEMGGLWLHLSAAVLDFNKCVKLMSCLHFTVKRKLLGHQLNFRLWSPTWPHQLHNGILSDWLLNGNRKPRLCLL